jgi:basic membrane protein A and related proteins
MRRTSVIPSLVVALALIGASCGSDNNSGSDTTAAAAGSAATESAATESAATEPAATGGSELTSVGMALPGPKNDKGFNQSHYDGLIAAGEKYGFTPNVVENVVDPQARIDALKNLAADNPLVIGVGGEYAEAGLTAAPQFSDVGFVVINGETSPDAPNLHAYFVRQGVPAYIAGVVAAQLTKSKKVGYLGGELIPPTTQSDDGFKAGVAAADPSIEYASTIVGNFNDPEKAKEAAAAQISAGADVIFALLDAGFPGVEQAVTESGKDVLLINPIFPRCDEGPNIVGVAFLSSGGLVDQIVSDYQGGTLPAEAKFYGVENQDIQRFELCDGFAEHQSLVDETTAKINSGEITLPDGV